MKTSHLSIFILCLVFLSNCEKIDRNNPWDNEANVDPGDWAPQNITLSINSSTSLKLTWEYDVDNIEGFVIDRKKGNTDWQTSVATLPPDQRNYADNDVDLFSDSYTYRVYAYAGQNTSSVEEVFVNKLLVLFEGFEGPFPPNGWATFNLDGGTGWTSVPVSQTAPAAPDGGARMAVVSWKTGGQLGDFNDQWLVTPEITVYPGQKLQFYIRYDGLGNYDDILDVRISETSQTDPSAFNILFERFEFSGTHSTDDWVLYISDQDLASVVDTGKTVYIAFREHVENNHNAGGYIFLDNVFIGPVSKDSMLNFRKSTNMSVF